MGSGIENGSGCGRETQERKVTPEGRVKAQVKRLLDKYKARYEFWPVPYGYGASTLDCLVCFCGRFIAIETKAPGKKPTDRQRLIIEKIRAAGGVAIVIDGEDGLSELQNHLESIKHASLSDIDKT